MEEQVIVLFGYVVRSHPRKKEATENRSYVDGCRGHSSYRIDNEVLEEVLLGRWSGHRNAK